MNRFRFRLWDNDNECYEYIDFRELSRTNEILTSYEEYFYDGYFERNQDCIEQCTGLKDKNGNLIYEGDIIRFCANWRAYVLTYERIVVWDKDKCGFAVRNAKDQAAPLAKWKIPHPDTHIIEIVGNIHNQKDTK